MAAAAAAAAATAVPKWVMLERFVFRRDDPNSFPKDERTFATSTSCTGTRFEVSFVLSEPPTPSRLYVSWPEGDKANVCNLLAADRDLVLLRLDSVMDASRPYGEIRLEYFIYIADPTSQIPPLLRPLPQCMEVDPDLYLGRPSTCMFPAWTLGLLCDGEDKFAVANLHLVGSPTLGIQAELWVLRTSKSCCCGNDVAGNWEKNLLPILHQEGEDKDLLDWDTHDVVPFKNSLCWVNYASGILICDFIFGDSPKVSYIRFPMDSFVRDEPRRMDLYRSLCVTDGGSLLVSVDVARHDGKGMGSMTLGTGFTLIFRKLEMVESRASQWKWKQLKKKTKKTSQWKLIDDRVINSDELWNANSEHFPHEVLMHPLLSMDDPNIVHFVLFDWELGGLSLVTIDSINKAMLGSVVTYMKPYEEGLSTDDADLVEAKPNFFTHFLPSEFPKFLKLNR